MVFSGAAWQQRSCQQGLVTINVNSGNYTMQVLINDRNYQVQAPPKENTFALESKVFLSYPRLTMQHPPNSRGLLVCMTLP